MTTLTRPRGALMALLFCGATLLATPALADPALDARLIRLERMLGEQTLSDLVLQIQRLQQEVAELRGQVEMQQYQLQQLGGGGPRFETAPRLGAAGADGLPPGAIDAAGELIPRPGTEGAGGVPATPEPTRPTLPDLRPSLPGAEGRSSGLLGLPSPEVSPGAEGRGLRQGSGLLGLPQPEGSAGGEQEAYRAAFEALKGRDYPTAKRGFEQMLGRYPEGQYAESARYWLGEIGYVTQDYQAAIAQFNRLVTDYPTSPKVPTALLKVGYVHIEREDPEQARAVLQEVLLRYPDSTEASLAQGRLERMGRD